MQPTVLMPLFDALASKTDRAHFAYSLKHPERNRCKSALQGGFVQLPVPRNHLDF